jgi:hypothetical protein
LEANLEKLDAMVEHQEVPKEEASVETVEHWRSRMGTSI